MSKRLGPVPGSAGSIGSTPSGSTSIGSLVACLVGRAVLAVVGGLLFWATLPLLAGWQASAVMSGSMAPSLIPGDVIVSRPMTEGEFRPGQVLVVEDPDHRGRLRAHRLEAVRDDGLLVLRGDANQQADSTPVRAEKVRGVARLRVPYLAAPLVFWSTGEWWALGLLLLAGVGAVWGASTGAVETRRGRDAGRPDVAVPARRRRRLRPGAGTGCLLLVATLSTVSVYSGRFQAAGARFATATSTMASFTAVNSFCSSPGSATVPAAMDSWVKVGSNRANGSSASLFVGSGGERTLVQFTLPTLPPRCSVTSATLTLRVVVGTTDRDLDVYLADRAWSESAVNGRTNMPLPTGAASGVRSASGGSLSVDVASQVAAMYQDANYGFVIKDRSEVGIGVSQEFLSRESGTAPTLSVTFG